MRSLNLPIFFLSTVIFLSGCATVNRTVNKPNRSFGQSNLKVIWQHPLATTKPLLNIIAVEQGSPLVVDNVVYAASSGGEIIALELSTGRVLWRKQLQDQFHSTPLFIPKDENNPITRLVLGSEQATLWVLNAENGTELLQIKTEHTEAIRTQPAYSATERLVYFIDLASNIYLADYVDGKIKRTITQMASEVTSTSQPQPIIIEDRVFFGLSNGTLISMDLNGAQESVTKLFVATEDTDSVDVSDLVVIPNNNLLLAASPEIGISAIRTNTPTEKPVWEKQILPNKMVFFPQYNFVVATSTHETLTAFNPQQNNLNKFVHHINKIGDLYPAALKNHLVVASSRKGLLLFGMPSGEYLGEALTTQSFSSAPAVNKQTQFIVVKSNKGTLTALEIY